MSSWSCWRKKRMPKLSDYVLQFSFKSSLVSAVFQYHKELSVSLYVTIFTVLMSVRHVKKKKKA